MKVKQLLFGLSMLCATALFVQKTFTPISSDLGEEETMTEEFNGFGCTGTNQSPQLSWAIVPQGTKSFAVTMYDPDVPTANGWWHWLVFDIPANSNEFMANAGNLDAKLLPEGIIQSGTDYRAKGYGGPFPPEGHGSH